VRPCALGKKGEAGRRAQIFARIRLSQKNVAGIKEISHKAYKKEGGKHMPGPTMLLPEEHRAGRLRAANYLQNRDSIGASGGLDPHRPHFHRLKKRS